ncbi:MAG: addiction module protein [Rhodocyclaceae bacterium]|nr:addiction module protein [Rhodocyclaceae bacterium]MBZ0134185.1 addiction module protein [Rhodocyclaceae bacterium]
MARRLEVRSTITASRTYLHLLTPRSLWHSFAIQMQHQEEMMSATIEELEAEALGLPTVQRARLVEKLIASLDVEPGVENAWAEEVERRHAEIENGAVSMLPGAETLARLKADFQ